NIVNVDPPGAPGTYPTLTSTVYGRGTVTPDYPIVSLVADPAGLPRRVFKFDLNKTETDWELGTKFRAALNMQGSDRYTQWSKRRWFVGGFMFDEKQMLMSPANGHYNIFLQWHDGPDGMTGNPPFSLRLVGGSGVAGNAKITWDVKR